MQSPEVFGGFSLLEFKSKSCGPHSVTAGITCIRDANMLLEVHVYMCMCGVITSTLNRISRMRPLNCFFLPAGQISELLLL